MPANPHTLALEQLYLRDQRALQLRIAQAVERQWAGVDPGALDVSLRRFAAAGAALIALGQRTAQVASAAYVRTVVQLEVEDSLPALGTAPGVAGRTVDGRPVADALGVVAPVVFLALRGGRSVSQALRYGQAAAARTAVTQVGDAGRQEVAWQGRQSGGRLSGWAWVVDRAGGCAACLASANNDTHDWDERMESHPWCSCTRAPVVDGAADDAPRPTGEEIYAAMDPQQQADTFHSAGDAKAALVADGTVDLSDLVQRNEYHAWRDTLTERPLSDVDSGDD